MQYIIRVPKRINLFVVLTLIVFLTPVIMQITKNNYVKLIEDAAYLIMLLQSVYIMLFHNRIIFEKSKTMLLFVLLLLTFTVIGIYYNGISLVILQFREFKYLLLLVIMIPYADKEYFKHVWTVLKIIAAISIPVSVIQWFIYKNDGDRITGLLGYGGSGTLTLFVLIIFFTELGMRLQNNKSILGYYILYLIPTALNETKITLFLFPVLLLMTLILTKKLRSKQTIIIIVVVIVLFFAWAYSYERMYSRSAVDVFSSEFLENYLYATHWVGDAGRIAKVIYAFNIIKDTNIFLGYGLGSSYIGGTSGLTGIISRTYYNREMFGGTKPQLFLSLLDKGLLGTILIIAILIVYCIKVIRKKNITLEALVSINCFTIIFATLIYQNIFYTYQIMYIFALYTILHLKQESNITQIDDAVKTEKESTNEHFFKK